MIPLNSRHSSPLHVQLFKNYVDVPKKHSCTEFRHLPTMQWPHISTCCLVGLLPPEAHNRQERPVSLQKAIA